MFTIERVAEMGAAADGLRRDGRTIGFVPTMGALHDGHLSLVKLARTRADVVVVSVFVNPSQFGPGEDFSRYPRDMARDSALAAGAGAHILFAPAAGEMYSPGHSTWVDAGPVAGLLEGKSRPGHFRGVATVVAKLFNIVKPHVAVFGQKDAQQAVVIRRMASDLGFPVDIVVGPTVREPDGLAMSSRNAYLSPGERAQATALRRSLDAAIRLVASGERDCAALVKTMREVIASAPDASVDYISVADPETLGELRRLRGGSRALISLAVRIGKTRLIDNDFAAVN